MVCTKCGNELRSGDRFCLVCGTEAVAAASASSRGEEAQARPARQIPWKPGRPVFGAITEKRRRMLPLWIAGAVTVLVLALAIGLALWARGRNLALILYVKDDMLCQADLSRPGSAIRYFPEASTDLTLSEMAQYSSDYVWIAYPGTAAGKDGFSLYLQKALSGKPLLLAGDAAEFLLLDGGRMLYTDVSGVLYLADSKGNSTELDDAVTEFRTDRAGRNVIWVRRSEDGAFQMYAQPLDMKRERTRLSRGFESYTASPDGQSFAFLSEGELFISTKLSEAKRADRRVENVAFVSDDGTAYYERSLLEGTTLYDLLDDDLLLADATLQMGTSRGTQDYLAAVERDELRETLREMLLADSYRELCACDSRGEPESLGAGLLTEGGDIWGWLQVGTEENQNSMSDFYAAWKSGAELERALFGDKLRIVRFDPAASVGFYLEPEEGEAESFALYSFSLSRGMDRASLLSDRTHSIAGICGDEVWYFADFDGEGAALYRGDELSSRGALPGFWRGAGERACFFTDWDGDNERGTLWYWNGKSSGCAEEGVSMEALSLLRDGVCFTQSAAGQYALGVYDGSASVTLGENISAYLARDAAHAAYLTGQSLRDAAGTELDTGNLRLIGAVKLRSQ